MKTRYIALIFIEMLCAHTRAKEPFLIATNEYVEMTSSFLAAYNAGDIDRAISLFDFSQTPNKERHIYRLNRLRQQFTNIWNISVVDMYTYNSLINSNAAWIQIGGGYPEILRTPKHVETFTCTINNSSNGYIQLYYPLLRGVAPTQVLTAIIGIRNPDQVTEDQIINIIIDSDR